MADFKQSGSWNDGREKASAHAGQKIYTDYGLDRSSVRGSESDERTVDLKGSNTDLSHSLSGASAKQEKDSGNKSKVGEV
jgi:hypothetical protein